MSADPERSHWRAFALGSLIIVVVVLLVLMFRGLDTGKPTEALRKMRTSPVTGAASDTLREIAGLDSLYRQHPDHTPIALRLGELLAAQGNHRRALECFRSAYQADTSATGWEAALDVAREYYALGQQDSASVVLLREYSSHPNHPGLIYNLGAISANRGDTASARTYWERLLSLKTDAPETEMARRGLYEMLVR